MRATICFIKNPLARDQNNVTTTNPVLETRIQRDLGITSYKWEFNQQHQHHPGQEFAVLRIARYFRTVDSVLEKTTTRLSGASLMTVETTGKQESVALLGTSVPPVPEPDDINQRLIDEMDKVEWVWREVRVV